MPRTASLSLALVLVSATACKHAKQAPLYGCMDCDTTRYTVVLRDSVRDPARVVDTLQKLHAFQVQSAWTGNTSSKAFTATLDEKALRGVREDPRVAYVQQGEPRAP